MYYVATVDPNFDPPRIKRVTADGVEDYVQAWRLAGALHKHTNEICIVVDETIRRLAAQNT